MSTALEGRCLCGAVRMSAVPEAERLFACHCSICRLWTGGVFLGFSAEAADVTITGPVRHYRSSPFGERTSCESCGSPLWFREDGKAYEFTAGLFPATRDWPLHNENYTDRAHRALLLAGDHKRVTSADYEARAPHVEALS
ncbi:GFA family protein [Pseudoroseicyclus sp. CXY001]|uniref:GFA family protein n=1 Tax=Pseudoroseicyclus sp. CXY001 TaxID=3242492 RepID=UPI003570973A